MSCADTLTAVVMSCLTWVQGERVCTLNHWLSRQPVSFLCLIVSSSTVLAEVVKADILVLFLTLGEKMHSFATRLLLAIGLFIGVFIKLEILSLAC